MYLNTRSKLKSANRFDKIEKLLGYKRRLKKGTIRINIDKLKENQSSHSIVAKDIKKTIFESNIKSNLQF